MRKSDRKGGKHADEQKLDRCLHARCRHSRLDCRPGNRAGGRYAHRASQAATGCGPDERGDSIRIRAQARREDWQALPPGTGVHLCAGGRGKNRGGGQAARGLTSRSTGPLAGGAYAPSARRRLAWFVRRPSREVDMSLTSNQTWNAKQYSENARFVSDLGMPVVELLAPLRGEDILDFGCGD